MTVLFYKGDFNAEPADTALSDFSQIYNLRRQIREKTCSKNPNNSSCIELIITNRLKSFQNSRVIETRLSDLHKMCITVMNLHYRSTIHYRKFKDFNNDSFIKALQNFLTKSLFRH